MPAPNLRHYSLGSFVVNTWTNVHSAVPANRALVGRVVVTNPGTSPVGFHLSHNNGATQIGGLITLYPGEQFEQAGVVLVAGEALAAYVNATNGVHVHFMGEEVDN
jgi:hypothetical protein